MIFLVIFCAATVLTGTDAKVRRTAVSRKAAPKSAGQLMSELQVLEKIRQDSLKKAFGNPKYKADPRMMENLSVLSLVDSLFLEYHNYYNAMNKLIRSDEESTAAHQALTTIKSSRERLIKLYKAVTEKGGKLQKPNVSTDNQMNLLETVFGKTLKKNDEIEAELRVEFEKSPFINHMKNMPNLPNESPF
nr:PREDICTED: uncharacterized protein LOC109029892 isoform X2 [Bemisia tabaci]